MVKDRKPDDSQADDEHLTERLLTALDSGAPVDAEQLAEIGRRCAAEFEKNSPINHDERLEMSSAQIDRNENSSLSAAGSADRAERGSDGAGAGAEPRLLTSHDRSAAAPTGLWKMAAVVSVCLSAIVVFWMTSNVVEPIESRALGDAFRHMESAEGLHLKVIRNGEETEVWVHQPGLVRLQETEDRYQIVRGSRLWEVDSETEEPVVEDAPAYLRENGRLDLLSLIGIDSDSDESLMRTTPVARSDYAGKECYVYRRNVDSSGQSIRLEAFVDEATGELLCVSAWERGAGTGTAPFAEVRLVAVDPEMDEGKFRVPVALADDGRIGKLVDSQGIVTLRPDVSLRWTPVFRKLLLSPGDLLRTDARGANAATASLVSNVTCIVGPHSMVELSTPTEATLHYGILQIEVEKGAVREFTVNGARGQTLKFAKPGKTIVRRTEQGTLLVVEDEPRWLAGYLGTSATDSVGSLIVEVDGRNTPLSVGEHHVRVEIRDQIARTTIEETFKNHTDSRLEGTFHFPLPQDASISGFGMWIGGELVEADVVEKQRAREIYETILREKRDPGLLEWTGGNIFKARVFPIEPHSEKRVKITYTQVLPLRARKYRYAYALKSEMLTTSPLRELSITATVSSDLPVKSIESPSHTIRSNVTANAASAEFRAETYTPTKDFELVVELDEQQSDVVVIPHQRGDDGYFLLQLSPPGASGFWQREVLPDGEPLELILLCDTSASMDAEMRQRQSEFVSSILASLSERDRFNVATCDVTTEWLFKDFTASSDDSMNETADWLGDRVSLGWTDLEDAFQEVFEKAGKNTHVIYVGDGIVSTVQADPQGFVQRLTQLYSDDRNGTFHSVSVGSSYESTVLKAIAALGGGSTRQITSEQTPRKTAFELLNELSQPGLKNVEVEFRGVEVAAVYPNVLPNIPAGTQQILVGRYLPSGEDQKAEVVVTGVLDGEDVKYVASFDLADAEKGNSFIPRLWARGHLDELLKERATASIREEIISLSEEFHIITPYSSLLVLESDADRERFGVKRRFQMRDGERFFAEGKARARYELKQQQMRLAGEWRIGLRRQILARLSQLGRNSSLISSAPITARGLGVEKLKQLKRLPEMQKLSVDDYRAGGSYLRGESPTESRSNSYNEFARDWTRLSGDNQSAKNRPMPLMEMAESEEMARDTDSDEIASRQLDFKEIMDAIKSPVGDDDGLSLEVMQSQSVNGPMMAEPMDMYDLSIDSGAYGGMPAENSSFGLVSPGKSIGGFAGGRRGRSRSNSDAWIIALIRNPFFRRQLAAQSSQPVQIGLGPLNPLFPYLAATTAEQPKKETDPPEGWTDEALRLSKSLSRLESLKNLAGGLQIKRENRSFDAGWDALRHISYRLELFSSERWLTLDRPFIQQAVLRGSDEKTSWALNRGYRLGRIREGVKADLDAVKVLQLADYSLTPAHAIFRAHEVSVADSGEKDRKVLVVKVKDAPKSRTELTIDTSRNVLVKSVVWIDDIRSVQTVFSEFVETEAGLFARRVTTRDAGDRMTSEATFEIEVFPAAEFGERVAVESAPLKAATMLPLDLPSVVDARLAESEGRASIADRIVLLLDSYAIRNWDSAFAQMRQIESGKEPKAGIRWIRLLLERVGRQQEAAKQKLQSLATDIAASEAADVLPEDELWLAHQLLTDLYSITDWNEFGRVVDTLQPVYLRQKTAAQKAKIAWMERRLSVLQNLGQTAAVTRLMRELADLQATNASRQTNYAQQLHNTGQIEEALAWLRQCMGPNRQWDDWEVESIRSTYCNFLEQQNRWEDVAEFTTEWMKQNPKSTGPYERHLSALVFTDRLDEVRNVVGKWTKEGETEGKLSSDVAARVSAAVNFMLGRSHRIRRYSGIDGEWLPLLFKVAVYHAQSPHHVSWTQQIVGNGSFSSSDEGDRFRGQVLARTEDAASSLSPTLLSASINWLSGGRMLVGEGKRVQIRVMTEAEWASLASVIRKRWDTQEDAEKRGTLHSVLVTVYSRHLRDQYLPFLRAEIERSEGARRVTYRNELFNALLTELWTEEIEEEAFGLIPLLSEAESMAERLRLQVQALHRLTDSMVSRRQAVRNRDLHDKGETDKLTRTQIAARQAEFLEEARQGVADRYDGFVKSHEAELSTLAEWVMIERDYLLTRLESDTEAVVANCWKLVGNEPVTAYLTEKDESTPDEVALHAIESVLKERAFMMLLYFAARKNASDELVAKVTSFVDGGLAVDKETIARWKKSIEDEEEQAADVISPWRRLDHDLLIALDDPDRLEAKLRGWIASDRRSAPSRLTLGRLRAERGDLDEAIKLFEAVLEDEPLSVRDGSLLAGWYQVVDRESDHLEMKRASLEAMTENQLSGMLRVRRNQIVSGENRTEIPDDTIELLDVLLSKSSSPSNYFWIVRDLYRPSHDFRLLKMMANAAVGRTRQSAYGTLQSMNQTVLVEIRDEAVADVLLQRLDELRAEVEAVEVDDEAVDDSTKRSRVTDLRMLDLLEMMVERKAAEVLNQPGPHIDKALAAMKRSFGRKWATGERRQMAELLYQLGKINAEPLQKEQFRQLRLLRASDENSPEDRLQISNHLALLMFHAYGLQREGIELLQAAVGRYLDDHDGKWRSGQNSVLAGLASMYRTTLQFVAAEELLNRFLKMAQQPSQVRYLVLQINTVHVEAWRLGGRTSLGEGATLYRNLMRRLLTQLKSFDENATYNLVSTIISVLEHAAQSNVTTAKADILKFANVEFVERLKTVRNSHYSMITRIADLVASRVSQVDALAFLLRRVQEYPARLEMTYDSSWRRLGNRLGQYRHSAAAEVAQKGAAETTRLRKLERELLPIVLKELRRDLIERQAWNTSIYYRSSSYFWSAKAGEFLRVAETVLKDRPNSPRILEYTARYIYGGLYQYDRGIKILFGALERKLLDQGGKSYLVQCLHERSRYGESIPILLALIEDSTSDMSLRVLLMRSYLRTKQPNQLQKWLADTDEHFHQEGRWTESNIATLAGFCVEAALSEVAVKYFNEAISVRKRANGNRVRNDGSLSSYYQQLASAHSSLGQTSEAVDAASAAIVTWGSGSNQRAAALSRLEAVLRSAGNLKEFGESVTEKADRSGQDSPIIRKAIGKVLLEKGEFAAAQVQFEAALELQRGDKEVYAMLIRCHDSLRQPNEAIGVLLAQVDVDRHNTEALVELAKRTAENDSLAERAATSIVESAPNEAETHTALAELRESQDRWEDAVLHWEQAAEHRRLEPDGLYGLANAQIRCRRWKAAEATLSRLRKTDWDPRFSDVSQKTRQIEDVLRKSQKAQLERN